MHSIDYTRAAVFFLLVSSLLIQEVEAASRKTVKGKNGMVVSADSSASAAGITVLKNGGNAIDAAVAVGFALAVTFPEAGNIGGGGFMLIRLADGSCTMIDFREKAPSGATRDMFLDEEGNVIAGKSSIGPLAAGVPGAVAGLLKALEKYGTADRRAVLAPAIGLAENGIVVDERLQQSLVDVLPELAGFPSSTKAFTKNGIPYVEGDVLRQPDLAATLRAISEQGRKGFYGGKVAELIVAEMAQGGGMVSLDDLAGYEAVERAPLRGSYRGFDIVTSSPPSAGGVVLLQMLNMIEGTDLPSTGLHSSQAVHTVAFAAQCAYADRSKYLGDPDFVEIPVDRLISKEYARERLSDFDPDDATPGVDILPGIAEQSGETTHFCVADRFGNVVSCTMTINDEYGCKTVVEGAGFLLNNQMDDFSAKPMSPNMYGLVGTDANAIEPGKRMLSSMTPTMVVKDGMPVLALGGRGGSRITTAVLQAIVNVVDFRMGIQQAVDAGRFHHQWMPDKVMYEKYSLPDDVLRNLESMGYVVEQSQIFLGRLEALWIDRSTGLFHGAPDPREQGVAIGY